MKFIAIALCAAFVSAVALSSANANSPTQQAVEQVTNDIIVKESQKEIKDE